MKAKISFAFFFGVLFLVSSALAEEFFTRKKVQPTFFIPEKEIAKPKTVFPTPQYFSGQAETLKTISAESSQPTQNFVSEPQVSDTENLVSDTPEYQEKYQEYLNSLVEVAEGKKMPRDKVLENDLKDMSSNKRKYIQKKILEDKEFNKTRPDPESFFKSNYHQNKN